MIKFTLVAFLALTTGIAHAQTQEEVGDLDSFNRNVTFLGVASPPPVLLRENCNGLPRCTNVIAATQAATFSHLELASIRIPGRTANSLICNQLPTTLNIEYNNRANAPFVSSANILAVVVVRSPVLDDPALIDPIAQAPFNGKYTLVLPLHFEQQTLAAGESAKKTLRLARDCLGGLVSKGNLKAAYGLTQAQADEFFRQPITIAFGLAGNTAGVIRLDYTLGARLYGDRR